MSRPVWASDRSAAGRRSSAHSARPPPGRLIDQRAVVEKILLRLGLWSGTPPLAPTRSPPNDAEGPWTREPCEDVDPMPDYKNVLTD